MWIIANAVSDPTDVIFWGIVAAVGLVRFVLWLIRPPRWQDLEGPRPTRQVNGLNNWWW